MADMPFDTYRPETDNANAAQSVLIVTADNTEDLEFFYPYYRLTEAGFKVDVATPEGDGFKAKQGLGLKQTMNLIEANAADYAMLFIPGGKAPAMLKENADALTLVKEFVASGKPVAAICHGPQVLAKADVIKGRKIAAWPECESEVQQAGATFVNQETVVDGQFVTARWPGDLPAFTKQVLQMLNKATTGKKQAA